MSSYELLTAEEWSSDPFCSDFRVRHALGHVLATGVSPDPHVAVGLSVQRALNGAPYTSEDVDMLSPLGRHVEKSLRLSIRLLDAEFANLGLGEALARVGIGVFALDSLKRVVFSNPAGKGLLGDGLRIDARRLLVPARAARALLDERLEEVMRDEFAALAPDPRPIIVEPPRDGDPLILYILPVPAPSLAQQFLTHTRAIVLAIKHERGQPADPALVRDLLGVTLGEARVAALVGSGLPPREAAERLGVSEETIRTTLKRVFSKTGVSRQSELAVLLTKLALR